MSSQSSSVRPSEGPVYRPPFHPPPPPPSQTDEWRRQKRQTDRQDRQTDIAAALHQCHFTNHHQQIQLRGRDGERLEGETGKGGGRQVQEVFIKLGSQLRLVCSLRRATAKPTFLFWCLNCPPLFTSSSCFPPPGSTMTRW